MTETDRYPNSAANATAIIAQTSKPRLRRWEASEYLLATHGLSVATATLAALAVKGGGPKFNKAGRWPLYPLEELDAWARERLGAVVANTSEAAANKVRSPRAGAEVTAAA